MKNAIFILMVLLAAIPSQAGTIYVDVDANGLNDGSSWTDAYNHLQDALTDANMSDKPVEIRVAQGTYKPDRSAAVPDGTGNREATFQLINGVTLKGGYAGFGRPDPNARHIALYETILTGDIAGESTADNSYHVVIGSRTDETAVLDGFVITRGNANGDDYPHHCGGGMYNDVGSPTVVNCTFGANLAYVSLIFGRGAGMYNVAGSPSLTGCRFVNNHAEKGGGLYNDDSTISLVNCVFSWKSSAMVSSNSNLSLVDCTFVDNGDSAGSTVNYDSTLNLNGCTFIGGVTTGNGGGMCNYGSTVVMTDCAFIQNTAEVYGGGMYNFESDVTLRGCSFIDNFAGYGGGMFNQASLIAVHNCTFKDNVAYYDLGGGVCNDWPGIGHEPGTITNCTFTGNQAPSCGGMANFNIFLEVRNCVFVGSAYGALFSDGPIINCIVWNNTPVAFQLDGPSVEFSNVQGGYPGVGNIDADPRFVDLGHWDDNGTPEFPWDDLYVSGDYHLRSQAGRYDPNTESWVIDDVTSPCIDAGDPMSPIGQEPFPNGGVINIGAYGGTAEASKSYFDKPPCEIIVAGDINGDCLVDFSDFWLMGLHWMEENQIRNPKF